MRFLIAVLLLVAFFATGCRKKEPPVPVSASAQELFERAAKLYHLPAAPARGAEKEKLLAQAAAGYEAVPAQFPNDRVWCAQAIRSLGNVRVEQGRIDEGVKIFQDFELKYPEQEWEVLQAWKTGGDVLWDAGRKVEAKQFYERIVARFDTEKAPQIYKSIVRGAKSRL